MRMNEASFRSESTIAMAAPVTHIITTLYTLRPMCFESLRAGIETCRVSQAKKAPNTCEKRKSIREMGEIERFSHLSGGAFNLMIRFFFPASANWLAG